MVRNRFALTGLIAIMLPSAALAQVQAIDPQAARQATDAAATTAEDIDAVQEDRTAPLAAGLDSRVLSKNEAYNIQRAAEGRVGVRLGDDMSFRVPR